MKIVSLNTWAGRVFDPLMDFVSEQGRDTDIFCFQEVFDTPTLRTIVDEHYRTNLFFELQERLPRHIGHFASAAEGYGFIGPVDFPLFWGLAMFLRRGLIYSRIGEAYVYGRPNTRSGGANTPRNLQYVTVHQDGVDYIISHFHGLWNGQGKTDTPDRLEQSRKAKALLDGVDGKKVICGDFNLLPDTESLAILEGGLVNLIKTHGITTTRSSFYERPDRFADYTLVSPDVEVKRFEVPRVEVSDHLPMILEYS